MYPPATRILVVDDNCFMRTLLRNRLKEMGFSAVTEARNGIEALAGLAGIELVVSDFRMPGMDGLELLRAIRADARTEKLPFLMITTKLEPGQIKATIAAKVDSYVTKPFTVGILRMKLEEMWKRRHGL